ncbi:hypothetical protein CI238_13153 [Colletotrichum incanum]|uniref:Uncharacterized protein n=1 Tax=Colletotrichum incanum TaxID=1573173 RepID=A0A167BM14_COLIC|nr:hypothetical protein CI238_13153 [Colletotrichum incanum]
MCRSDQSRSPENSANTLPSAHGRIDQTRAFATLVEVACSDPQGPGSQDQPYETSSENDSPHNRFDYPIGDTPPEPSDVNPRQIFADDPQDEEDSSFGGDSDKENKSPETPYQVVVLIGKRKVSLEGFIDCVGRPVDLTLSLPTPTKLFSVKLCITADLLTKTPQPLSTRCYAGFARTDRFGRLRMGFMT